MKLSLDELQQLIDSGPEGAHATLRFLMERERKFVEIRRKDVERKRKSKVIPVESARKSDGPSPPSFSPIPPHITTPSTTENKNAGARARGNRLPEGFMPAAETKGAIRDELGPIATNEFLRCEHAKFCDHWKASSGANASKRDWDAAWRNWMRKAAGDQRSRAPPLRNGLHDVISQRMQEIEDGDGQPTFSTDAKPRDR